MAREFQGLDTPAVPALRDCVVAYCEEGYVLIGEGHPGQYYKPFEGMEPWDCKCVAIWKDDQSRVWAEEY